MTEQTTKERFQHNFGSNIWQGEANDLVQWRTFYNQSVGWQREIMTENKLICPAENLSVWTLTNFKGSKEEDGLRFKAGIVELVKV